jgi:hypothetical protein
MHAWLSLDCLDWNLFTMTTQFRACTYIFAYLLACIYFHHYYIYALLCDVMDGWWIRV